MPASLSARLLRAIQPEDALLFTWFAVAEPLMSRWLGAALATRSSGAATVLSALAGMFCYFAALCALACLVTRSAAVQPEPTEAEFDVSSPSGYARLPMIVVLGILLNTAGELTGLDTGDRFFALAMLVWFGAFMLQKRLPQVPGLVRRLLMSPTVVFSAWFYTDTIGNAIADMDLPALLGAYGTPEWGMANFMLSMTLLVTGICYLLFVFAPRQVAGSGGSWFQWFARFGLYLLGVVLNLGPLQIIG